MVRPVQPEVFAQPAFEDYQLLDSGEGEKLERIGAWIVRRPDPQALWPRRANSSEWSAARLRFERDPTSGGKRGSWIGTEKLPQGPHDGPEWSVRWRGATCLVRPTPFKHVGLF